MVETTALARRTEVQSIRVRGRDEIDEYADRLSKQSAAPATERAYATDLAHWQAYAESAGFDGSALPVDPEALRRYITVMAKEGLSVSTIRRRCAAIGREHKDNDIMSPTKHPRVSKVLRGLSRERTVSATKKTALTPEIVIVAVMDPRTSVRDRALLLFGLCSAMRRSEIAAVKWKEVVENEHGVAVRVRRSKADKLGRGASVGLRRIADVPRACPVHALLAWKQQQRSDPDDLVFDLSDDTIAQIAKRAAKLAGRDPDEYGAHSLRSGFATNAAEAGVPMEIWMKHTRHASHSAALGYAQSADAMTNAAAIAMSDALRKAAKKAGRHAEVSVEEE